MNIGVLGGTFDPPHKGHLSISKEAVKKFDLKKVIWAITKKNPFKKKSISSLKERVDYCKKIIQKKNFIEIKFYENKLKSNHTIDLINFFNTQDETVESFRVFGSSSLDLANTANGKIDCYFSKNLNFQNSTAGLFLVKEAGGVLHQDIDNRYSMVTNNNMIADL